MASLISCELRCRRKHKFEGFHIGKTLLSVNYLACDVDDEVLIRCVQK